MFKEWFFSFLVLSFFSKHGPNSCRSGYLLRLRWSLVCVGCDVEDFVLTVSVCRTSCLKGMCLAYIFIKIHQIWLFLSIWWFFSDKLSENISTDSKNVLYCLKGPCRVAIIIVSECLLLRSSVYSFLSCNY